MSLSLALEAAYLVDRLDRLSRAGEAAGELNPAQWEALRFIARANRFSRTPAALAEYLGATRGTISQTLITLELKGHVTREPSERDRRSIDLGLTARGEQALANDPLRELAAGLAASDTIRLEGVVATLRGALSALIMRNGGRSFGACHTCRHFRRGEGRSARQPHRCGLLDEPLSDADSVAICVEHDAA